MTALAIDTLRYSKRLQAAGVPQPQADAQAEAISEAVRDSLVTKADLSEAVSTLRAEIRESKVDIIKWLVPLLFGQTAVIVALVKLL